MSASLTARCAIVVCAVAAAVVLAAWQRSEDACTDAVKGMFFALRDDAPPPTLDATIDDVEADCPGSARLVDAGAVLFQQHEPERAERILREAVAREPESFSAWAGLASVLAESDPAGSRDAAAEASRLNPFYRRPS